MSKVNSLLLFDSPLIDYNAFIGLQLNFLDEKDAGKLGIGQDLRMR